MAVELLPEAALYPIIAKMADSGGPGENIKDTAQQIKRTAEQYLAQARATTPHTKLPTPMVKRQQASGLTDIGLDSEPGARYGATDYLVWMEGGEDDRGAMAIEMGHNPSGYFAGTATDSPRGLYILHRAAGLTYFRRFRR
jgi:hypothetical protein